MKLYKYCPPERIDFFPNFTLRATPPNEFNDIYECNVNIVKLDKNSFIDRFILGRRNEILDAVFRNKQLTDSDESIALCNFANQNFTAFCKTFVEKINKFSDPKEIEERKIFLKNKCYEIAGRTIGILCFSKKYNNLLMWGHYTQNHAGFVIEIEISDTLWKKYSSTVETQGFGIREVIYTDQIPEMIIDDCYNIKLPKYFAYTKNFKWNYEEEIRWVFPTQCTYEKNLIDIKYLLGEDCLKSITLGIRTPIIVEKQIRSLLKRLPGVILYRTKQTDDKCLLTREEIKI